MKKNKTKTYQSLRSYQPLILRANTNYGVIFIIILLFFHRIQSYNGEILLLLLSLNFMFKHGSWINTEICQYLWLAAGSLYESNSGYQIWPIIFKSAPSGNNWVLPNDFFSLT